MVKECGCLKLDPILFAGDDANKRKCRLVAMIRVHSRDSHAQFSTSEIRDPDFKFEI